jgi:hypothetical protein
MPVDTKQASALWGVSEGEVGRLCRDGFVHQAKKQGRKWRIPDGALPPYRFEAGKADSQLGRKTLILQALSAEKTIPESKLSKTKGRLALLFDQLVQQGLITPIQGEAGEDLFGRHLLTAAGETFLEENKTYSRMLKALPKVNVNINLNP